MHVPLLVLYLGPRVPFRLLFIPVICFIYFTHQLFFIFPDYFCNFVLTFYL